ncbi:MAG: HD domain-containing protein [Actinobacteria bacterium]|nr:MAG: HD domain-containing protein [Actinomycetota bacterium]
MKTTQNGRWEGRPVQAALLRLLAVAVPVAAGVLASVVFSHAVKYPHGIAPVLLWWIAVLAISTVVVAAVERQCRRLLPLATLLKLSMIFPDKAPSRFGVALRAGTVRNLEERVVEMRARGIDDEPSRAAEQILELVGALGVHDRATRGHAEQDDRDRLRWAALLHDVGKVTVPTEVLNKPGKPDEEEWRILHSHPEEGAKLAAPLREWLGEWADTIEQHHERWDGLGYPHGLKGEKISRGARIVAVADSFEVMTAARSYKRPMDVKAARQELTNGAGTQFDPAMVRAFLNISLGRMRWMVGPLAWVAELPFLRGIAWETGGQAAGMAARVVAGATIFAGAVGPAATASGAPNAATSRAPTTTVVDNAPVAPPTTGPVSIVTSTTAALPAKPPAPHVAAPVTTTPPATAPPTTKPQPTNVPTVANNDSATTTTHASVQVDVTANDSDPDGDGLVFPVTISYPNASGKGAKVNLGSDGHTVNYVPNNHQAKGPDTFQYTVCDARGGCSTATVTVTVTP